MLKIKYLLNSKLRVGFTGSQDGMSDKQKSKLQDILTKTKPTQFHHGDCIGSDAEAHKIARDLGITITIHPPENVKKRAWMIADYYSPAKPYLVRNHDIVDNSDYLIAAPHSAKEVMRSGTWSTIRYARKQGKMVIVLQR